MNWRANLFFGAKLRTNNNNVIPSTLIGVVSTFSAPQQ
jgi:hypothetical protein